MVTELEFFLHFTDIVNKLTSLLEIPIFVNNEYKNHAIVVTAYECMNLHAKKDFLGRDIEINKLGMLYKHLNNIKSYRIDLFERFKSQILSKQGFRDYFGIRFEINIANSLITKKLNFTTPDPPDFLIEINEQFTAFECTTTYSEEVRQNLQEIKINRAVKNKANKDYKLPENLALLIDITNTEYYAAKDSMLYKKQRESTFNTIKARWGGDFGSFIFFSYFFVQDDGFYHGYRRIDTKIISNNLKQVLDIIFPSGIFNPNEIFIPKFS